MTEQIRLRWPVDKPTVTQHFGKNPDFYKPFGLPGHEGIDLYAPMNANIYAAADGEVYQVGHPSDHPYGLHIRIQHQVGETTYRTIYAHLAKALVSAGQRVKAGDRIGLADNTGNSFGSHLHLTLKVEGAQVPGYPPRIVDPWPYFQEAVEEVAPASDLIVYTTTRLSLRADPTVHAARRKILAEGEALTVLGDPEIAQERVGQKGEWIHVQTASGERGHVAAWFVRLTGQSAPVSSLIVYPTHLLSLRARPSAEANRLTTIAPDEPLNVLGDINNARAKIGRFREWLNVRAPSGHIGYVAAWYIREQEAVPPLSASVADFLTLTAFPTVTLNLRSKARLDSSMVGRAPLNRPLTVITDDPIAAREMVGKQEQWLFVRTEEGVRGWAAAWFLSLERKQ